LPYKGNVFQDTLLSWDLWEIDPLLCPVGFSDYLEQNATLTICGSFCI